MHRSLPAALLALIVVLMLAAPASAQSVRNPFDPLLSTTTTDSSTDPITTDPTDPVIDEVPLDNPAPSTDDLPNTGGDPKNWLGISYVLLAMGAALLVIGRERSGVI